MVLQQERSGGKSSEMASQSATDPRGVVRGHCTACSCFAYTRDESGGPKCSRCSHPPAKHVKKDVRVTVSDSLSSQDAAIYTPLSDLSAISVVAARTPPTSSAPVKLHHAWGVPSAASHSQQSYLYQVSKKLHFDPHVNQTQMQARVQGISICVSHYWESPGI